LCLFFLLFVFSFSHPQRKETEGEEVGVWVGGGGGGGGANCGGTSSFVPALGMCSIDWNVLNSMVYLRLALIKISIIPVLRYVDPY